MSTTLTVGGETVKPHKETREGVRPACRGDVLGHLTTASGSPRGQRTAPQGTAGVALQHRGMRALCWGGGYVSRVQVPTETTYGHQMPWSLIPGGFEPQDTGAGT